MSYEEVKGDLFESGADIIAHGCNTKGVMGAGVAAIVRQKWPHVNQIYQEYCNQGSFRGGECLIISTKPGINASEVPAVANLATQIQPGADARIGLIAESLIRLREQMIALNLKTLAMPRIGCGIGGLVWLDVEPFVRGIFINTDIRVTVYSL